MSHPVLSTFQRGEADLDSRAPRRGLSTAVVVAGFVALAWAALTVLFGGGAAHAEEESEGPLGVLTSLDDGAFSSAVARVAPVLSQLVVEAAVAPMHQAAPAVVKSVTQTVAEAPVLGRITTPAVETVTDALTSVTAPVTDVLEGAPVSHITTRIVEVVIGVVDEAVAPGVPVDDDGTEAPRGPGIPTPGVSTDALRESSTDTVSISADATHRPASDPTATRSGAVTRSGASASTCSFPGSSSGPSNVPARFVDTSVPPPCAWARIAGAPDEALPSSPVAETDVSPD